MARFVSWCSRSSTSRPGDLPKSMSPASWLSATQNLSWFHPAGSWSKCPHKWQALPGCTWPFLSLSTPKNPGAEGGYCLLKLPWDTQHLLPGLVSQIPRENTETLKGTVSASPCFPRLPHSRIIPINSHWIRHDDMHNLSSRWQVLTPQLLCLQVEPVLRLASSTRPGMT